MKENNYDNPEFFSQYRRFPRSVEGLSAAGEWHALQKLFPDFSGKRVLDLGCGFGWHCRYAADHGAAAVIGVDLSEKMLEKARADTFDGRIHYVRGAMEEVDFPPASFEAVLSSLALHYVEELGPVFRRVWDWLAPAGTLCSPASTRSLPPRAPRSGTQAPAVRPSIGLWTDTSPRAAAPPASWAAMWSNTTTP